MYDSYSFAILHKVSGVIRNIFFCNCVKKVELLQEQYLEVQQQITKLREQNAVLEAEVSCVSCIHTSFF